ncbi:zf-RING_2 domain-containing protein, partial [Cephalotus follicularis]
VRNALALLRRSGSVHFQDVIMIDRAFLFGLTEEHDAHQDLRLDVDDMSYEELLALGDRIGNVSTGLSEEEILTHLRRRKYQSKAVPLVEPPEPCCVCQEDYADGEDLGKLDCGHDFHFNCIKQWLHQKNSCPICKMKGL